MSLAEKNLHELSRMVFSDKYDFIDAPQKIVGKSGKSWSFDALIQTKELEKFGVFIRDWKREISITQLRQLKKACEDAALQGGVMITNVVSDFSQEFSTQFGIQLFSKGHLISKLRAKQYNF